MRVAGDILRILLLLLQIGFVVLLYLILLRFAGSLLRDLRNAEQADRVALGNREALGPRVSRERRSADDAGPGTDQLDRAQREQHV